MLISLKQDYLEEMPKEIVNSERPVTDKCQKTGFKE